MTTVARPVASAGSRTIAGLARRAIDLIFPPHCGFCGGSVARHRRFLCSTCEAAADRDRRQEACPRCAATVAQYEVSGGRCRMCRTRRLPIAGTVRVGEYTKTLAALVRSYKYRGRHTLERPLGSWLGDAIAAAPWRDRVEAVVVVPTHWKHRLARPLYVAEALATIAARRIGLAKADILRRSRGGPHQVGLSYHERISNVRDAFCLRRGVTLRAARLLLIDDVKTTGATLNECAKVLRRGGAAEVYAAVVVTVGWDPANRKGRPPL